MGQRFSAHPSPLFRSEYKGRLNLQQLHYCKVIRQIILRFAMDYINNMNDFILLYKRQRGTDKT